MAITIKELSRLCGVSTATVSLVLGGKDHKRVGAKRREQILALAEKYGYRHNPAAKGLAEGCTYRIGLAVEGTLADHAIIGQFSFYDRLGLLAARLRDHDYSIEIVQVDTCRSLPEICRELGRLSVDGFVFPHWFAGTLAGILLSLKEKRIPAVASGTTLHERGYTWTDVDRAASFTDAVRRLAADGHREIALLDCTGERHYFDLKRTAFVAAVREYLGSDASDWVFLPSRYSSEQAVALTGQALRRMPGVRAFLLTDNFYADAVLYALRRAGLRPGQDCRVIGFGDTVLADRCRPRLSHYSLQVDAQVEFSVRALFDELRNPDTYRPRQQLLGPLFISRAT